MSVSENWVAHFGFSILHMTYCLELEDIVNLLLPVQVTLVRCILYHG